MIFKELKKGSWWARYKSAGTCVYTAEINNATFCKHVRKYKLMKNKMQHANYLQLQPIYVLKSHSDMRRILRAIFHVVLNRHLALHQRSYCRAL